MKIKYRRLYGLLAVLLWLMLLGTAGSAELHAMETSALIARIVPQVIGMAACTRCAMGG